MMHFSFTDKFFQFSIDKETLMIQLRRSKYLSYGLIIPFAHHSPVYSSTAVKYDIKTINDTTVICTIEGDNW